MIDFFEGVRFSPGSAVLTAALVLCAVAAGAGVWAGGRRLAVGDRYGARVLAGWFATAAVCAAALGVGLALSLTRPESPAGSGGSFEVTVETVDGVQAGPRVVPETPTRGLFGVTTVLGVVSSAGLFAAVVWAFRRGGRGAGGGAGPWCPHCGYSTGGYGSGRDEPGRVCPECGRAGGERARSRGWGPARAMFAASMGVLTAVVVHVFVPLPFVAGSAGTVRTGFAAHGLGGGVPGGGGGVECRGWYVVMQTLGGARPGWAEGVGPRASFLGGAEVYELRVDHPGGAVVVLETDQRVGDPASDVWVGRDAGAVAGLIGGLVPAFSGAERGAAASAVLGVRRHVLGGWGPGGSPVLWTWWAVVGVMGLAGAGAALGWWLGRWSVAVGRGVADRPDG
ncbi:MAG: hypothetical protein HRU70_09625 [Phycisphaeraceae bacterium]|nr:MAG: hypothetical protein HRU70_09625 [Phycisphaeraceae bacterium]